ncbi:hypothetical protein CHELA20_50683 [Hyphomicrobiales bacterium]|nr:hypothetical protein CHELA20_50683 [Hyphomicrobiales bacterium]CAH1677022.1 hypothetical protein CHELA41_24335 [Hyphomicrobiales bacterium]
MAHLDMRRLYGARPLPTSRPACHGHAAPRPFQSLPTSVGKFAGGQSPHPYPQAADWLALVGSMDRVGDGLTAHPLITVPPADELVHVIGDGENIRGVDAGAVEIDVAAAMGYRPNHEDMVRVDQDTMTRGLFRDGNDGCHALLQKFVVSMQCLILPHCSLKKIRNLNYCADSVYHAQDARLRRAEEAERWLGGS